MTHHPRAAQSAAVHDQRRAYDHRFHAGNVGDVWKHAALLAWITAWRSERRAIVETHAGAGTYALGPTGEWTEGVGRIIDERGSPVDKYLELVRAHGARRYPGSPTLARAALGPADRLVLHEIAEEPLAALRASVAGDARVELRPADGLAGVESALAAVDGYDTLLVVDPPYADRGEWSLIPAALGRALAAFPRTRVLLWYPVKSHARPNAMIGQLAAHFAGTALELITAPLTFKKNRLNGSGLIVAHAPDGLVPQLSSLAAWLGPRLSIGGGFWQTRGVAWGRGDHHGL